MGEIADLSALINRATGGNSGTPEHLSWFKNDRVAGAAAVATIAGRWTSLWPYEGSPSHGVSPVSATGAALDNTTQGGLKQTDPAGGRQKWLTGVDMQGSLAIGTLVLYDRLAQDGGLSGVTTTSQAVSFTPPARYADGLGNQIWLEIATIIGTTGTTVTCAYTDQTGGGGASVSQAVAIGATGLREVGRIIPVSLAAGDTGVTNITDIDLVATTGTAGDIAALLVHPLCTIPCPAVGLGLPRDFISGEPGPIEIMADACLAWAWIANGTAAPQVGGILHMIED